MTATPIHKERLAIIRRAIDWLEANPERHIRGKLSVTRGCGQEKDPRTQDETACFCVLGRIVHEANPSDDDLRSVESVTPDDPFSFYNWLDAFLAPFGYPGRVNAFHEINDYELAHERHHPLPLGYAEDLLARLTPYLDPKLPLRNERTIDQLRKHVDFMEADLEAGEMH